MLITCQPLAQMFKEAQDCGRYKGVFSDPDGKGFSLAMPNEMVVTVRKGEARDETIVNCLRKFIGIGTEPFNEFTVYPLMKEWDINRGLLSLIVSVDPRLAHSDIYIYEEDDETACKHVAQVLLSLCANAGDCDM